MSENLILEIYAEEIPASYIDPALKQMETYAREMFGEWGVKHGEIKTYATPNRLVLFIETPAPKSLDKEEELLGPSLKAAKTPDGKFTPAAIGFASKNGTAPENLTIKKTDKGEYLSYLKKTKGIETEIILQTLLPDLIKKLNFPKSMVWEESMFRFARPVRSILALYGGKFVKFNIADVKSSNFTIGLHATSKEKIEIKSANAYLETLKKHNVIANQAERKALISDAVKTAANVIEDDELTGEVNYLVEYPTAVACSFDKRYLALPDIVLIMCLKRKQKCFAVRGENNKLANSFVCVRNGVLGNQEVIKQGYEKVVSARLSDAEFFYNNDLKRGIEANIEKLKGIVFHKEIGTVYEKVERLLKITKFLNEEFRLNLNPELLAQAVKLSKADLVSEMVFEYPELQGVMGKIYAQAAGVSLDVACAIEEHYLPLSASSKLPENSLGLLISLADKLDTLCANFAIGLEPTGSADPYGLRRAAISAIRIMAERFPQENFARALEEVFNTLPEKLKASSKFSTGLERLRGFFWQRIENILENEGYRPDEVKAVVNASKILKLKAIGTMKPKLEALKNARGSADFADVAAVFKRINNILAQSAKQNLSMKNVDASLLSEAAEKDLYKNHLTVKDSVEKFLGARDYSSVFGEVLKLKPFIDAFFDSVMVMAEDPNIKINRISLLNEISEIFKPFIDFSSLQ
ncbi:MAG: glycine--tRNA ligase subunit beta [Elusimicrobia bacterium]|nr:glycine--tRNA ligase subunit beta [Elusimicrobiota bacterium]